MSPASLPTSSPRRPHAATAWTWTLAILLLADLAYSFFQHYHATLDGDMASVILPASHYAPVLRDPLGFHALFDGVYYTGPNRFVPHWTMERWYRLTPRALQIFATPLDSIYLAGAIAKTAIQAALIYLISAWATGCLRLLDSKLLMTAVLVTPVFQTYGLEWHIGIINGATTYTFFYPAASAWLLAFFLPHALWYLHGNRIANSRAAAWMSIPLAWAVAFNGPLNPAVMLMLCPSVLAWEGWNRWWRKSAPGSRPQWIVTASAAGLVFAVWSYLVGRYNIENLGDIPSLAERYALLPKGIEKFFSASPAVLLFADVLLLNLALVNVVRLPAARTINKLALGLALFAIAFILLLPIGGYRTYRPLIIRSDSIQPIILGALVLYACSGLVLLRHFSWKGRLLYGMFPLAMSAYFLYVDKPMRGNNYCEREALKAIAASPEKVVRVDAPCTIMAWERMTEPEKSARAGMLLFQWGIFPQPKLYYQPVSDQPLYR